jgi:hypothetical protein
MGGMGSGQWRSRGACQVDRFSSISINDLRQRRLLSAGELRYHSHNEQDAGEGVVERIQFAYTRTNFGGRRAWFLCPGCGRRCGKLANSQCACHGPSESVSASERSQPLRGANRPKLKKTMASQRISRTRNGKGVLLPACCATEDSDEGDQTDNGVNHSVIQRPC